MFLRIFEPRYVRMVKEACASDQGFGICMLNAQGDKEQNQHIFPLGTFVKVTDFDLLEDGLLGITVKGQRCFEIRSIHTESDGLRVGQCTWLDNWFGSEMNGYSALSERLEEVFGKYEEINHMHPNPDFANPAWVVYRWLELLPIDAEQKQSLLQSKDCYEALGQVSRILD